MEDKDLQKLFQSFQPELSSDSRFMDTLLANMKKVEFLKRQQAIARRQNRIAVAVAAVTGFVAGVVFMLVMPYVSAFLLAVAAHIPSVLPSIANVSGILSVVTWFMVGLITVTLSVSSYRLTVTLLSLKSGQSLI